MKRSDYLLKGNIGKKKEEKKPQKRSEKLLKNPVGMTSGAITSSTATEKPKTTAAPKVTTSKKDKSYTGVDAEINRREASRSARYSMQPEVRAAEIKRAEARGDTKRASELKKATDIEQWAKEQVNSDFVKTRAQTVYDNEFNAAKLRGDQSPAVAAEHAAQGYLDLFRNKPQETRNETYAYRQAVRKNEYEGIDSRADYNERVIQGRAIIPQGKRDAGQSIIAYLNSPELRRQREERGEQFGDGSTILEHISVMTDAEKNRFRYLAATGDWDKVNDYYDLIKRDLNKRAQEETNKETYAESYNSPVKGAVKNVAAGFITPGAYIATGANAIANQFRDDYIPVDTNSPMFAGAHMARETSSGVTERAYDAVGGGTAGEFAKFAAGTGLSMANFLSKAPLGGVGSMVAMGLDSAGQTTLDVLERGGTEGKALILGTAAGAIEAITEKLPLDNLFKIASEAGEKGLKATVKEFLKQGAIEATEEMISELSNSILDAEVMRDKSEYQSYIATLMQNGMTREDAEKEAIFQIFGMKTLKAGAAGLLSGLVMGGGATAVSKVNSAIESRNAGAAEGEAGFTKNEFSEKVSNKTIRALDAIGKKIGTNISIGAPTGNGQGSFNGNYENGRIVISQDADDPLKVVLSHEVTHRMKETAPEAYAKFLEIAVNATEQLSGKQKSEILEDYKTWYSEYSQTDFKYEDALDEITADFAGRLADDLSLFKKLVDTDRNVAQRFIDGVREFISKVKSTFSKDKSKADTASLEKYGLKVSELEEAVKQWSAMVKATETAVKSGNAGIENTAETEQGGVVYDLKKDLLVDLKNLLVRKNKNSEELLIGTTSDFLVNKLGANPLQVTMPKNKAYAAMVTEAEAKNSGRYDSRLNYHGLGADLLYEALEASENPVVAFVDESNENEDRSDRIVLVTDKKKDENNIVVIMQVDADGTVDKKRVKANKDITVFDRKSLSADISKAIENNRLLYFDKKRSQTISAGDKAANSPSAIQKVDFKDNIARFWANVNWKKSGNKSVFEASAMNVGTPFEEAYNKALKKSNSQFSLKKNTDNQGRELSAEQAEYFKDSKARDKDGNLLVMYHQTGEDFSVFETERKGAGSSDDQTPFGIFMKTSDKDIGLSGKKQMPLYANIINPLRVESRAELSKKLREISPEFKQIENDLIELNKSYKQKTDKAAEDIEKYLIEWRERNPEAKRRDIYNDAVFNRLSEIEDATIEEWETKDAELTLKSKKIITDALKKAEYDGVILELDSGSFGRETDAYIALSPEQVKNIDNKTPTENPDIRYSLKKPKADDSTAEPEKSESDEEAFRRAFGDWAYDPEEESSYLDETGLADDAAQNPKEDYSNIDALYADYAQRENIIAEEAAKREQELIDDAYNYAISGPATEKKRLSEKVSESGNYLKRKIVNSGAAIRDIAKVTKDKFLYPIYNRARGSMNIAEDMLTNKQTNIRGEKVGESLESIILPIKNKGKEYFREFHLYLLNKHNVARMSLENPEATAKAKAELDKFLADNPQIAKLAALGEDAIQNAAKWDDARGFRAKQYLELRNEWQRLNRTRNKPIFFDKEETPLSADISRTKAEELLKKHPEFAEYEAKVKKYLDNLMQYRVDSGLITQEEADYFRKKYPDYVPTYRNKESVLQELYGKKNIGKTLGIARGGVEKLLPLDIALAEMTKKVIKNGQKNIFTNKLFDIFEKNSKLFEEYITDANEGIRELDKQIDEFGEDDPKFKNTVGFYKDGKYIELTMTPKLYEAFAEMSKAPEEKAPVADWWRILNNGYKKLITTYDPTFIIRNGLKDLQDATINSRDTKAMLKNLPKAYAEIANGGELFELYKSMGGLHSSRFDEIKTKGVEKKSWVKKLPDALAFGNMMVEQAPRLAEFMSVLEKGDRNDPDVLADALYAAADITTNFGENGTWGKVLNAYYVPFLNPAIQGTAKIGRLITEPKTAKQWYGLAAKAIIMGVGAGFINDIIIGIFGDDEDKEEYEKLQDRVKDNYFLIPTDDGKFAKIPKGRIAASLGVIADRVRDVAKGEKVSAGEAVARILENIAPENPITNNILSPFIDAKLFNNESKGRTWYGGDIESDSLQGLPAGERFDSSTDYISKIAGKALGLSPKKINYILKQYTGGAGRTILPMLTPSEQKGDTIAGVIGYGALSIITSNFMVDSKLSNKVSGDFYDAVAEAEQKKNSSKGTLADKVVYKHLNRERNQMSGYNKKIREAETDSSLTSKERDVAVRTATASRSEYQKEVLDNLDKYRANVEKYLKEYPGKDEEKAIDYAYRKANYATYGAEYAIRVSGGKSVYDKALEKVNRGKTTWEEYYDEYFGKDERRYEKLRKKYDISYAEYEKIAEAMSKNSTEEEEIEALHKLGYKRSTARGIRRNFNKVK